MAYRLDCANWRTICNTENTNECSDDCHFYCSYENLKDCGFDDGRDCDLCDIDECESCGEPDDDPGPEDGGQRRCGRCGKMYHYEDGICGCFETADHYNDWRKGEGR